MPLRWLLQQSYNELTVQRHFHKCDNDSLYSTDKSGLMLISNQNTYFPTPLPRNILKCENVTTQEFSSWYFRL